MLKKHFGPLENMLRSNKKFKNWDHTPIKCNSLGYRSEEYNPKAKYIIFTCGCSYTMGNGLLFKNTWPQQFKKIFSKNQKIKLSDINILNFGVEGASNNYIARTMLSQCSQVKPDFAIIYFTHFERSERIKGNKIHNIAPFLLNQNLYNYNPKNKNVIKALSFYDFYTNEIGFINLLKNILLLQNCLKQDKIKYMFSCVDIDKFKDNEFISNRACKQYLDLIDMKNICDFNLQHIDAGMDKHIDKNGKIIQGGHPGPKSNRLFAERLYKFYIDKIACSPNP